MKAPALHLVGLLLASAAFAAATETASVPQPRARLNPNGGTVAFPQPAAEKGTASSAVVMEKYVVRQSGTGLTPARPATQLPATGKFRLLEGARIVRSTMRGVRAEIGLWPWEDVFAEDAKFKEPRARVDVDFARLRW